jgi:hypothetical protein
VRPPVLWWRAPHWMRFHRRSAWTYFKRLWRFGSLERRFSGKGTLKYRISNGGAARLRWLRKLYHMGFRSKVARSTLADANEFRDWRIYADFAQVLIAIARPLYASDPIGVELTRVYMLWTPPPLIFASRCFLGLNFANTKRR